MKEKLKQMGYKMQRSMIGRYGIDALYKALLVIYLILVVTGSALARVSRPVYTVLWVLSLAVLIYAISVPSHATLPLGSARTPAGWH